MRRLALAAVALAAGVVLAQERAITPGELKSGSAFLGSDLRALQNDDFANPGMLWVERGEKIWREPAGEKGVACASWYKDKSTRRVGAGYSPNGRAGRELIH